MNSIIRRASVLPLKVVNGRRVFCDVIKSDESYPKCRLTSSELSPLLAKYVPSGLPFAVRDSGSHYGILLARQYGDEAVVGEVTDCYKYANRDPSILMEFAVSKGHQYIVFGTFVSRDSIFIRRVTVRSPMCLGYSLPGDTELVYLEGFEHFLKARGINCSTINFLFDRFEKGLRRPHGKG